MTISIQPPKPGDLITSNFMKQLIDQLAALDRRLTTLEQVTPGADGKVAITQITPSDVAVGDPIQIIGLNFGLPGDNIVSFDGVTSIVPTVGDERRLTINVPAISFGGAQSKSVLVVVTNKTRGFDSYPIAVHQAQPTIPGGTIIVSAGQIPPITPGGDFVIPFNIDARANMDETYDLIPSCPLINGQPAFTMKMVTDLVGATELVKPYRIFIRKPSSGSVSTFATTFLKISVPSNTTVTNPFVRLDVNSVLNPPPNPNPLAGSSSRVSFTFGQGQQPQTITFSLVGLIGVTGDLNNVTVPLHTSTPAPPIEGINYSFKGFNPGNYTATLTWDVTTNSNSGWTASFGGSPSTAGWPRTTLSIPVTTAGDFAPPKVAIVGVPGAMANTLRLTVRSDSNPSTDFGIHNQGVLPGNQI